MAKAEGKPKNQMLGAAKAAKRDEFYTQYVDIQKEVEAYLEFDPDTFRDKIVYCNCDDPFESNFFKYFAANFNRLGLKKLVTTSYDGSSIAGAQLTDAIPSDYDGMMGVPITILDKYNPDQFEIMGYEKSYDLQTKTYESQVQVNRLGKQSNVTKLNDGAVIKVGRPPTDKTYYVVDGEYYIQQYKRIFIRHHRTRAAKRTKK